jgi:hypothetical protein
VFATTRIVKRRFAPPAAPHRAGACRPGRAHRNPVLAFDHLRLFGECIPDPLRDRHRALAREPVQHDRKLFAAQAADEI